MKRTSKIVDGHPVITLTFASLEEFLRYQEPQFPRPRAHRGKRPPIRAKVRAAVKQMHKDGATYKVIQAKHHISKNSIGRILRAKVAT